MAILSDGGDKILLQDRPPPRPPSAQMGTFDGVLGHQLIVLEQPTCSFVPFCGVSFIEPLILRVLEACLVFPFGRRQASGVCGVLAISWLEVKSTVRDVMCSLEKIGRQPYFVPVIKEVRH